MLDPKLFELETGWVTAKKQGEPICGDFFRLFENESKKVFVLSDGLGSGIKANILSTLTATMLGTMLSRSLPLDACVRAVAAALPVCHTQKRAYSTFTVLQIERNIAYLVQCGNPCAILLRDGKALQYDTRVQFINEKEIHESRILLQENDVFILFTDGVTDAGIGKLTEHGWELSELTELLERLHTENLSAPQIAARIMRGSMTLSEDELGDDASVLAVKVRKRQVVNMLVGPPENKGEDHQIMNLFFAKNGIRVVCGGSTANAVSKYLEQPLHVIPGSGTQKIPPMGRIEGVDYVTEGVLTLKRVLEQCNQYLEDPMCLLSFCRQTDAASLISTLIIEKATDVNIYFGMAANTSHESTEIDFDAKLSLMKALEACLLRMRKRVKISFC